ncbi:MAG TPA: hypothetical protein VGF78_08665 [Candidatus Dormibacteraeota bacterium]
MASVTLPAWTFRHVQEFAKSDELDTRSTTVTLQGVLGGPK